MKTATARHIVLAARPTGTPQLTDFRLEDTAVPTPRTGQMLLGVQSLSLDPSMRGRMEDRQAYAKPLQVGEVMIGEAVARVLASKHSEYAAGDIVDRLTDWGNVGTVNLFVLMQSPERGRLSSFFRRPLCAGRIPPAQSGG